MFDFIFSIIVTALSFLIGAYFIKGVKLDGFQGALIVALVMALLNGTLGWLLQKVTFGLLGWGLLHLLLDAIIIMVASKILKKFDVDGWGSAILLAVVVALCNGLVYWIL